MHTLKLLAILAPFVLIVDVLWLGAMKGFYAQEIGELTRRNGESLAPRWGAAILVYFFIPAGLVLFVRPLFGPSTTMWHALGWGAVFGFVLYGVYDMTNLAVLEKWTLRIAVVDMAWGGALCGISALMMRAVDSYLAPSR